MVRLSRAPSLALTTECPALAPRGQWGLYGTAGTCDQLVPSLPSILGWEEAGTLSPHPNAGPAPALAGTSGAGRVGS